MPIKIEEFYSPTKVGEALSLISSEDARILAGSTTLGKLKNLKVKRLVNIMKLPLSYIKEDEKYVHIGATTTIEEVLENHTIKEKFPFIHEALSKFGAWGIRTMATIGGSVFTSFPWSDVTPLFMVLDARVHLLSSEDERLLPIDNFLDDKREYMKGYLLKEVILDKDNCGEERGFRKIALSSFDLALLNFAYVKGKDFVRISVGARPGRPIRLKEAEESRSIDIALKEADLKDDFRVSKKWREEVLKSLLSEVLS